jgi:hypothetical protein
MILVLDSYIESYCENLVLVQIGVIHSLPHVELESYFQYLFTKALQKKGIPLNLDVIKICNFYLKLVSNSENITQFKEN